MPKDRGIMRVFGPAFLLLQFIGTVLDIRDLAGLLRRGGQASAVAWIIVGAVNWVGGNVPDLTLILFGAGTFVLLLVALPDLWTWLPRRRHQSEEAGQAAAPSGSSPFDPYAISSYLAQVDLTGLSQPDSFMMITLNVRNASGYRVTITGVKGRIRCAAAECNPEATVEGEPRQLRTSAYDRVPCTIRQPISNGMMHTVALARDLPISLSALQWVGSVDGPQGSVPLESCYIHEDFVVKGPFREKRDAGSLFRLRTTFLSSEHYDSDGEPKRDEDRHLVQESQGLQAGADQLSAGPRQQLSEGVRALLREGNQVLDAIANVNQPIPKALAENWFKRGKTFFEDNLSGSYVTDWNHARHPKQGFTGMITQDRKQMWDSVKARVELLEAIDDELRGS